MCRQRRSSSINERPTKKTQRPLMGLKPTSGESWAEPGKLTLKEIESQVNSGMAWIREMADYKKGVKKSSKMSLEKLPLW